MRARLVEEAAPKRRARDECLCLPPSPKSAALARRRVRDACLAQGRQDLVDAACLVVSELVANAVVHAPGSCELHLRFTRSALRLEVLDAGSGAPDPRAASADDEHGRGLRIVTALCAAWGVEPAEEGGKLVWAELDGPASA